MKKLNRNCRWFKYSWMSLNYNRKK